MIGASGTESSTEVPMSASEMLSTGDVCRLLDVPEYVLQAMIRNRNIEPPLTIAGRRAWTDENVSAIRRILAARGGRRGPGRPPRGAARPRVNA